MRMATQQYFPSCKTGLNLGPGTDYHFQWEGVMGLTRAVFGALYH